MSTPSATNPQHAVSDVSIGQYLIRRLQDYGVRDVFGESGTPDELFEKYGLSKRHIAEAAQKVRERTAVAVPEPPPMPPAAPPAKPQPVSMERALNDAEAQIAALDAVAAKTMGKRVVRKGVPSPPPLPR